MRRSELPQEQQAIRDKCFHPSGMFVEFPIEDVETSIPARFEKIVRLYPNNLAFKMGQRSLTYDELNRYANRIAHAILEKRGAGSEPIALFFENSIELVAAILGVLKAGKFYVVLDPTFPYERVQFLLEDSSAKLVITDQLNQNMASKLIGRDQALITSAMDDGTYESDNLSLPISSQEIACIQYTSGSTGTPKGVVALHFQGLCDARRTTAEVHVCANDRLTLLHSLSFGSAHSNLRLALLNGASIFGLDVKRENIEQLAHWLRAERISILHSPPVLFRQLANSLPIGGIHPDLRLIRLSGAPISKREFELYKSRFGSNTLMRIGMGASETKGVCSAFLDQSFSYPTEGFPIGYPHRGVTLSFVDDDRTEVLPGEVGEIAVTTQSLAPSYWKQPDRTNDKFLPDPDGGDDRIYLTGDLGRMLPDGFVVHLGRKDLMVKIRGYRVDFSEVERALLEHPAIKDAGVRAWDREEGEKDLAAYIVLRPGSRMNVSEIRQFLSGKLPDYMIPPVMQFVEALPLTNGKLDRQALPTPEMRRPELKEPYVAPRNEVERKLARIWSEVLQIDDIGVHDNFFDLGGHSLTATRIISRVTQAFEWELAANILFEASTIAQMAAAVGEHRGKQPRKKGVDTGAMAGISRRPLQEFAPLSFAQERLWFLNQLEPESAAYNEPSVIRLSGLLNVKALERALNDIIARHEVLRTTFELVDGCPVQRIVEYRTIDLPVIDLRSYRSEARDAEARQLIDETIRRPFNLSTDLMLRALLTQTGDREHLFVLVKHHIASDGWSSEIFWREFAELYTSYSSGEPANPSELPIQYADYAVWQREWLKGEILENQVSYWKQRLEGISDLQLPTDQPRPAIQSYRGARRSISFSRDLADALRNISRKENVTLYMVLLAAFQVLLSRYSGQTTIAVGSPIANRTRPELEGLIGFFANTLILRGDFHDNPTFKDLLVRQKNNALEAYDHQDLPFEKLVQELRPERNLSRSPLFQVMFSFQNASEASLNLPDLEVFNLEPERKTAKFDLFLSLRDKKGGLRGALEYSTDLFDASTIDRMVRHFETLLKSIVNNPDKPIADLAMLTESEKHRLLIEWNDTKTSYPKDKCIHQLFEAQVEKSPDAVAVVFEDQKLTYQELNHRANQLAHHLQNLGVGPDVVVGICMQRSIEMIVGLLGILKADGAYLPLDPTYPKERVEFMLADSQARFLLTEARLKELTRSFSETRIEVDSAWREIALEKTANASRMQNPETLAYVIYTSGSTGKPKGVMIEHRSVVNFLASMTHEPGLARTDVLLAVTTLAFDIAGLEIYLPLSVGAHIELASREVATDGIKLAEQLKDCGATVLHATPSTWRMLLASGWQGDPELKVLCGGEALSEDLAKELAGRCASLWNMYGPTETTIWSAIHQIPSKVDRVAIGKPIANTQVYILDTHLNPVPIGVSGEIYIGGDGVARGYLNRPELTAEKFIPNLFSSEPGTRLYKTGDLARYRADGNIEFLGRIDNQVKIRGYRIELGEIEAVLGQHPSIEECVVLAREDNPEDKRLVAYVVPAFGTDNKTSELRRYLQQRLPDYMVPSAIVFLDALPLTPNGKLDRKALPAPDQSRPQQDQAYISPRTPVERLLANIWAEVLKLDKAGIHDNFFELGGHSMLATQVVSKINHSFQTDIPLRRLFEAPTIASLVAYIDLGRAIERSSQVIRPILPTPRGDKTLLSFSQQRLWFLDQYEPNSSVYNVPSALRLKGRLDIGALERSLGEIIRRHEALRTTFSVVEGEPVQIIAPSANFPLPVIDLGRLPEGEREEEANRVATAEAQRPFDLSQRPLFRNTLIQISEDDHILLCSMHHIVSDGWSMGVLHRELSKLYPAFTQGKPSPLVELPIQYADYAVWQREWLQGEELERQLTYWKKQLDGVPGLLNLPTDRPRPAVQSHQGSSQSITLPKELSENLKRLSRTEGVTLFMTLLAAFQTLLFRYTGQEDIVVGSPIANRTRTETEGLIGFFVNTLVMRSKFSGNPSFREMLQRVRTIALEAYEHQDLPFEKLVEELRPERSLSHSPLFQVMLVLQNAPSGEGKLEGLSVSPIRVGGEAAKFDLTLSVHQAAEGLRGSLQYSTDLFDEATIKRMIGHFKTLLEGIVAHPEQRIIELPILSDAEKHRLLIEWNDTQRDYPKDQCVHQLFEAQVEKSPYAVAVVFEDQELTYRELNHRANQLAHHLQSLGVGPDVLVGICMERSIEMIVGLLGILKAGGAYVPLDPAYPKERLKFMLEDTKALVVLAQKKLLSKIDHRSVVCLDGDWHEIAKKSGKPPRKQATSENLAYVIYTSGSTGTPKGVMIPHKGLVNYLTWAAAAYDVATGQGAPVHSSIGFDLTITSLFTPLLVGQRLVIPSEGYEADKLSSLLRREADFSLIKITPAHLELLGQELAADRLAQCARVLVIGGEALTFEKLATWSKHAPETRLINEYGPTETVVGCCVYEIGPGVVHAGPVPIGRPIANTQIYILDNYLQPVAIGVTGEIYIGGDGVARGYLNCSELTAEQFIPNPFGTEPGARLYKTGDLARYLPDGNIEFLGRIDNQVKIRGYRIELGEIEAVLGQHPSVRETVVLAQEDSPGDKLLVGYVVAASGTEAKAFELKSFLQQKLPDYMVPSVFVFLDTLPLTPNGKVDRKALPAPDQSRPELEHAYAAPRTPVEELLANIWAEVLKLDKVGIHDNFFQLGGHSLLATMVMSRIREVFRIEPSLRALFETPTIAGLSAHIGSLRCAADENPDASKTNPDQTEAVVL